MVIDNTYVWLLTTLTYGYWQHLHMVIDNTYVWLLTTLTYGYWQHLHMVIDNTYIWLLTTLTYGYWQHLCMVIDNTYVWLLTTLTYGYWQHLLNYDFLSDSMSVLTNQKMIMESNWSQKTPILHGIWWYMCQILDSKIEMTGSASRTLVQFEQSYLMLCYTLCHIKDLEISLYIWCKNRSD